MFSTAPGFQGKLFQILAVSIEETGCLGRQDFIAEANSEAVVLVEGWIHQLGSALSDIITPEIPQLEGISYFPASGQIFQPSKERVLKGIQQGMPDGWGLRNCC